MRILVGDMPVRAKGLYEYLLESKKFTLGSEGVEYDEKGKARTDVARFNGPGNHTVEIMAHDSGFETVNVYRNTPGGVQRVIADVPALLDVELFKTCYATLWGVRK